MTCSKSSWIYHSVDEIGVKMATPNLSSVKSSVKLHDEFPVNPKRCRDSCLKSNKLIKGFAPHIWVQISRLQLSRCCSKCLNETELRTQYVHYIYTQ